MLSSLIESPLQRSGQDASSLLRLLHYFSGSESTTACNMHQDLGLLTIVPKSNVGALEIYDLYAYQDWVNIARSK